MPDPSRNDNFAKNQPKSFELQQLEGQEGDKLFSQQFPASRVDEEIAKAQEWEEWLELHEFGGEVLDLANNIEPRLKKEITFLPAAIKYLEDCPKNRGIPITAKFSDLVSSLGADTRKMTENFAYQAGAANFALTNAFKALITLEAEKYPGNATLGDVIEELKNRLENIKELIKKTAPK